MKLESIEKIHEGRFISRYDLTYELNDHTKKRYEIISRNHQLSSPEDLLGKTANAVVIVATNETGDAILLNKEFRLATNQWVYNFPAGLIDEGEDGKQAAVRELREETGLELYEIDDMMGLSFSAVGFSNETNITIVGKARGTLQKSCFAVEEIEAGWFTKEQVRNLLKTELFAGRTQAFCYLWSK